MQEDTQRNHSSSSSDEMPLWIRQAVDAIDAGEKKYGKLVKATQQKHDSLTKSVNTKRERLDKLLQTKSDDLVPKGEWNKFVSWLIKEYIGNYSPQHSAISAFLIGYTWQKDRKSWVSRNMDNVQSNSDHVLKSAENLRLKIAYHRYCYNILDWPEISDHDYDSLVKKLQNLENMHPELKPQANKTPCISRWLYEVEKLLEANFIRDGELQQRKTVQKRGGKLDQGLLQIFMAAIPDDPIIVVPDKDWQVAFSAFFERHFQEHTLLTACRAAFMAGAAWYKYREVLDQ